MTSLIANPTTASKQHRPQRDRLWTDGSIHLSTGGSVYLSVIVVVLDGEEHAVRKGSLVHIPPGVVHGARGRMRVLVTGIPDIADDDIFFSEDA